jgi:hypothetical protein
VAGAARTLFTDYALAENLARLHREQHADRGWIVDSDSASPAASLDWRGYATVQAVRTLLAFSPEQALMVDGRRGRPGLLRPLPGDVRARGDA